MGAYDFWANDQVPVHLDMWHKLQLGWAEPRIFRMSDPSNTAVREGPTGAIVLWDNARGANEYFIIERRRPNAPAQRYDIGVAGDGILIWRVQKGVTNGVAHMGAAEPRGGWIGGLAYRPADADAALGGRQSHQLLHHDERAFRRIDQHQLGRPAFAIEVRPTSICSTAAPGLRRLTVGCR